MFKKASLIFFSISLYMFYKSKYVLIRDIQYVNLITDICETTDNRLE